MIYTPTAFGGEDIKAFFFVKILKNKYQSALSHITGKYLLLRDRNFKYKVTGILLKVKDNSIRELKANRNLSENNLMI